jgi:RNA 3'-terminal phosphate cyclase
MALAGGSSVLSTQRVTQHLLTNVWVVNQFLPGCVSVDGREGESGMCRIEGVG